MAATIHDDVLDAALGVIDGATKVEVRASASVLASFSGLNSGNFGAAGDNSGSGAGRKMQCLVSDSSDMKSISVSSAGSANKVALIGSAKDYVVAEVSPAVALLSTDTINLGTFSVIIKDPT